MSTALRSTRAAKHTVSGCGNCQQRKKRLLSGIESHTTRMRQRSRLASGVIDTVRISLKSGLLEVTRIRFPDTVAPGGTIDIEVEVTNRANVIEALDPDQCSTGGNTSGYKYELSVDPSWGQGKATEDCIPLSLFGTTTETLTFSLRAPDREGSYTIDTIMFMPGSGREGSTGFQVQVDGDGGLRPDPGCDTDADCLAGRECVAGTCQDANGGTGPLLPCWADPNKGCATFEAVGWGVVGLIVLFVVVNALSPT